VPPVSAVEDARRDSSYARAAYYDTFNSTHVGSRGDDGCAAGCQLRQLIQRASLESEEGLVGPPSSWRGA